MTTAYKISFRGTDAGARGHHRGRRSDRCDRRGRRLPRVRRVARQGRRLRGAGTRRRLRHGAARLAHQRHRPAARRSCSPTCRRWRRCPATRRPPSARGRRRDARRARSPTQPRAPCATGSPRPRAPPAARPARPAARRQQEDAAPTSARGARRRPARLRRELRAGAARQARGARGATSGAARWHFIGPLQSNKVQVRRGQVALHPHRRFAALLDASTARGAPQDVPRAGERRRRAAEERRRARRDLPALLDRFAARAHVALRGPDVIPPARRSPRRAPHFAALRALRDRGGATRAPTSTCPSCRWG